MSSPGRDVVLKAKILSRGLVSIEAPQDGSPGFLKALAISIAADPKNKRSLDWNDPTSLQSKILAELVSILQSLNKRFGHYTTCSNMDNVVVQIVKEWNATHKDQLHLIILREGYTRKYSAKASAQESKSIFISCLGGDCWEGYGYPAGSGSSHVSKNLDPSVKSLTSTAAIQRASSAARNKSTLPASKAESAIAAQNGSSSETLDESNNDVGGDWVDVGASALGVLDESDWVLLK